jgi:hypothetical protein
MSENTNANDTTVVKEVEMNLDDINSVLNLPGADNVMIATPKDSVFTKKEDDKFLDNPDKDDEEKLDEAGKVIPPTKAEATNVLDTLVNTSTGNSDDSDDNEEEEGNAGSKTPGRQKVDKNGLVELAKKLIEEGTLFGFDDDKPIEKWTQADYEELIKANFSEREKKLKNEIPVAFFDSLPKELQYAAKYHADGGQDMKGLFKALAQVEENRQLDPTDEQDQEAIVRNYLQATRFGNPEEIQEEIDGWKTHDELEAKAMKFKPKLDAMQEQLVEQRIAQQEETQKKQQLQARAYMDNVYKVLEPAEINGIALDKKTQSMLYAGLIQPTYPSISGKNTNLLGHLLEKYQFVEPNHGLIAEALYLLADPEGYRAKVREKAEKETTAKTVRTLKTEESRKIASATADDEDDNASRKSNKTTIKRDQPSFFKRS